MNSSSAATIPQAQTISVGKRGTRPVRKYSATTGTMNPALHSASSAASMLKKAERTVVFVQPHNGAQHFEAVGIGVELAFAARRAVAVFNDDVLDAHVALNRMDGHFGFDLKAARQHRVRLDKLEAEGAVARHDILDLAAEQAVDAKAHKAVAEIVERALVLCKISAGQTVAHHHIRPALAHGAHHLGRSFGG